MKVTPVDLDYLLRKQKHVLKFFRIYLPPSAWIQWCLASYAGRFRIVRLHSSIGFQNKPGSNPRRISFGQAHPWAPGIPCGHLTTVRICRSSRGHIVGIMSKVGMLSLGLTTVITNWFRPVGKILVNWWIRGSMIRTKMPVDCVWIIDGVKLWALRS